MPQTTPDGGLIGIGMWSLLLRFRICGSISSGQCMHLSRYCRFLFFSSQASFVHKVHRLLKVVALFVFIVLLVSTTYLARPSLHPQRAYQGVFCTES
jgi:hypothetical protein